MSRVSVDSKLTRFAEILKQAKQDGQLNGDVEEFKKFRHTFNVMLKSNDSPNNKAYQKLEKAKPNLVARLRSAMSKVEEMTEAGFLPEIKPGGTNGPRGVVDTTTPENLFDF